MNETYLDIVNQDIIARIKAAIDEYGPSPVEIAEVVGATKEDVGAFIRQYPELREYYVARVSNIIAVIQAKRGLQSLICKELRVDSSVFRAWVAQNPKIAAALDDVDMELTDKAELKLWDRLEMGDWDAVKFVLLTKGGDRGYRVNKKSTLDDEAKRLGISVTVLRDKLADKMMAQLTDQSSNAEPTDRPETGM